MTEPTNLDVSWSVVFRLDDNDDWHDWTRNHADVSDAVKSAEVLVKTPPVVEIRFDRITVQRERFSLTELSAAEPATPVGPAPDNRAAVLLWAADQIDAGWFTTAATATAELRRLAGEAQRGEGACAHPHGRPGLASLLEHVGIDTSGGVTVDGQTVAAPCTCADAGEEFRPAGHYRDCPQYAREAQQDPTQDGTEAHPPQHTWKIESPRRDQWASWGTTYDERDWAVERYDSALSTAPQRPFRLVRATTTYTVEAEHTPTAVARPGQPETDTEADRG
jgi:hypothetical protein